MDFLTATSIWVIGVVLITAKLSYCNGGWHRWPKNLGMILMIILWPLWALLLAFVGIYSLIEEAAWHLRRPKLGP
jgi:small-conductance mechanosensitive channel